MDRFMPAEPTTMVSRFRNRIRRRIDSPSVPSQLWPGSVPQFASREPAGQIDFDRRNRVIELCHNILHTSHFRPRTWGLIFGAQCLGLGWGYRVARVEFRNGPAGHPSRNRFWHSSESSGLGVELRIKMCAMGINFLEMEPLITVSWFGYFRSLRSD